MQRRDRELGLQAWFSSTPEPTGSDLVFDFSGAEHPEPGRMALVLTARQMAEDERRNVWVKAMPRGTWQLLGSLGLAGLFEPFPASNEHVD